MSREARSRLAATAVIVLSAAAAMAQKTELDRPEFGSYLALWRISQDPTVEDNAGYHMQQVWSPDGRYLVYTHRTTAPPARGQQFGQYRPLVRLYDFHTNEDKEIGLGIMQGFGPVWANAHNWLFYVQTTAADRGFAAPGGSPVIWYDADRRKATPIGLGLDQLGGVDGNDAWVYGGIKDTARQPAFRAARVRIGPPGGTEELPAVTGFQWVPNPRHPVLHTRHDHSDEPFGANRWWWDLDGKNRRIGQWGLESCHAAWQGNGEHLLLGDGPARGRRFDEPLPGNMHVLVCSAVGNLSACGRSGRFGVGDSKLFDFRSGDAWQYKYFLSPTLKPSKGPYPNFDGEARGSPDGTKVHFTVGYDMERGPVTEVAAIFHGQGTLRVRSTAGFAEAGQIVFWSEVIGYERKTADGFDGLTRGMYGTPVSNIIPAGRAITDFRHHRLDDRQWGKIGTGTDAMRHHVPDPSSPLYRQRRPGLYVAVVRRPDRPILRRVGDAVQLMPGESHYETCGYHLLRDGKRLTTQPATPGKVGLLGSAGTYRAVAVEWSGLESDPSEGLTLAAPAKIKILDAAPADFSWTERRWQVKSAAATADAAAKAAAAVGDVVHRTDGVVAREWYESGSLVRRHDLNNEGKAIRRVEYRAGKPLLREYFNGDGLIVSRELFGADGFIGELILFNVGNNVSPEADHWWYDRGTPIRRRTGQQQWEKRGERWEQ